jgi:hypothetical protein
MKTDLPILQKIYPGRENSDKSLEISRCLLKKALSEKLP